MLVSAGGRLVSGSYNHALCVSNAVTGECERTLAGHTAMVTSLVALNDGRLVSGSRDSTLRMWNIATSECERALEGHTGEVQFLRALANGRVVSASDEMLRVWNAATGECEQTLHMETTYEGYTVRLVQLEALADGRLYSVGLVAETVAFGGYFEFEISSSWNLQTGLRESVEVIDPHLGRFGFAANTEPPYYVPVCTTFQSLPRLQLPQVNVSGTPDTVNVAGTCLRGTNLATMYVDAKVTALLLVTLTTNVGAAHERRKVVVASTANGGLHFFAVVPAC